MRHKITNIININFIAGVALAFLVTNGFCFIYSHTPYWFDRTNSATNAIWRPGSWILQAKEGYGFSHVDKNGYINPDSRVSTNGYSLVMGSSHTQGKEVGDGNRYTDLLNKKLGEEDLQFYNIGADGHTFNYLVQGMAAALKEFPNCKCIIMEIASIDANLLEGIKCDDQFDETQTGRYLSNHLSKKEKVKAFVKENLPVIYQWKRQFDTTENKWGSTFGLNRKAPAEACTSLQQDKYNDSDIVTELERIADYMRTQFDGRIIIVYHPECNISETEILWEKDQELDTFIKIMNSREIDVIDATSAFDENFKRTGKLPYGFMNTAPGVGHLNKTGHRILADLIWERIKGND